MICGRKGQRENRRCPLRLSSCFWAAFAAFKFFRKICLKLPLAAGYFPAALEYKQTTYIGIKKLFVPATWVRRSVIPPRVLLLAYAKRIFRTPCREHILEVTQSIQARGKIAD